jgi:tRNA (guanine-N7-)-methyltransferase
MQSIPDNFLSGIQIFFPDPWPKRRHHKRRLIQAEFVDLLWHKLKTGAFVHMATDWEDYAHHMMQVFTQYSGFNNLVGSGNYLTEDHVLRLHTKFELRGKRLGHGVWDMMFIKIT